MARIDAALALVFIAGISWLAIASARPPDVVPATSPADQFSAERAMVHVKILAREPHPMDSPAAARVRDYLLREMERLGLEPEILTSMTIPGQSLLGRLPGKNPGAKALMIAAHYDSAPEAPGAGDDAAAVGAILESLRALKAGPPLENDLLVLITDGEERGLFGAHVFCSDPKNLDRVGLVLNFEARGSRGPSYMFQTTESNGWMIREFALAAPHPMATSLAGAIYRFMPNDTDLTVFKNAGLKGLNFAFVEGVENYHQPTDSIENLDVRSVQHHGSYMVALARQFGDRDLTLAASEPDAIYFNTLGTHLVVYPGRWVVPLLFAAVASFVGVVMFGMRRGRVSTRGLLIGIGLGFLALMLAVAGAWSAWSQIQRWSPPAGRKRYQGSPEIAAALAILGIIAALCVYLPALRRLRLADLALGGLAWWLILTAAISLLLPGASYLTLWPLLFGLIGIGVSLATSGEGSAISRLAAYVGAIPALLLLPPTIRAICTALGPSRPFVTAPLAALLVLALLPMVGKLVTRTASSESVGSPLPTGGEGTA